LNKRSLLTGIMAVLILLSTVVAHVAWFPVHLVVVNGGSMEPTLYTGDILLAVSAKLRGFGVGDIVVWCSGPGFCVVHRVVGLEGGRVVTKGDNNPAPDPPVPRSLVKYVVVLRIPRTAWAPAVAAVASVWALRNRRLLVEVVRREEIEGLDVYAYAIALLALAVFISAVPLAVMPPQLDVPRVEYVSYDVVPGNETVRLVFSFYLYRTAFTSIQGCRVEALGLSRDCYCEIKARNITLSIPVEFIRQVMETTMHTILEASLNISLTQGWLEARHLVPLSFHPLVVEGKSGRLWICNKNIAPVEANITFLVYDWATNRLVKEENRAATIPPFKCTSIEPPLGGRVYAQVRYILGGKIWFEQKRVR
jgi:signal peptidase I